MAIEYFLVVESVIYYHWTCKNKSLAFKPFYIVRFIYNLSIYV